MKEILSSNCIGFVYHTFGLITEERFVEPPSLEEILRNFDRVDSIDSANALAVVAPSCGGPRLAHIAIVNDDKKTITHRKGFDRPVVREKIELGLKNYITSDLDTRLEIIYLTPKPH